MKNFAGLVFLLLLAAASNASYEEESREREGDIENIWALSRRSLKLDSAELSDQPQPQEEGAPANEDYEAYYSKIATRPAIQRLSSYRARYARNSQELNVNTNPGTNARTYISFGGEEDGEIADYDFDAEEDQEVEKYRHGKGGKKGKKKKKKQKKKKKKKGEEDSEENKKDPNAMFIPPFWLGKPKPNGWGHSQVNQIGYVINNDANGPGGWKVWPQEWMGPEGQKDYTDLRYIDGKGWVGTIGAPWANQKWEWGPGYGWVTKKMDEGKKGKKGKKKKKKDKGKKEKRSGKKDKKGKKKNKKKKKKKKGVMEMPKCKPWMRPMPMMGGGGGWRQGRKKDKDKKGKKKKGGDDGWGWMGYMDPCDTGPKPWFGFPQKVKFVPPPPRGSQVWLKAGGGGGHGHGPSKSGWSDYHGWNWKNKIQNIKSGWGVSDLIGVVHL